MSRASSPLAFRLLTNSAAYVGGDVFYRIINLITALLVVRSLGSEIYGYYSFIYVFLSFFDIFTAFGLNNILLREISQHPAEGPQWLGSALLFRLILIGISIPITAVLSFMLGYPSSVQWGILLGALQLFLGLRTIFETIFRAKLLMVYPALWNGVRAILNLGFVVAVVLFKPSLYFFILAAILSGFVSMAGLAAASQKFTQYHIVWDSHRMRHLFKECLPLFVSSLLTQICLRADVFLLSALRGFQDVGFYQSAVRIVESMLIIPGSLMVSIYPLLAEWVEKDRQRFENLMMRTFQILLVIGLPVAVGGLFVSGSLMTLFFGNEFREAANALKIYLWLLPLGFIGSLFVNVLYAARKQMVDVWVTVFQIPVNLALNFALIPRYGASGAAMAAVLSALFAVIVMTVYLLRHSMISGIRLSKVTAALFRINALYFVFLCLVRYGAGENLAIMLLSGVAGYSALMFLFKVVTVQDLKELAAQVRFGKPLA